MIHVDESDPVGENQSLFSARNVKIARGINPEEKYELIRELGRGKFGTVYRCREKATDLQLAAKFIGIPNRGDRRNVEREVDIMNTLQHHLVTQLYDAFEYQKMMCVVLELIEGGELFDRVIGDDFILTERACLVFVRQICQALEFVHRNHIVHLDLKPENIMCLTKNGNRIKIIDFGLARKFDPDKKMQILFGTPEFAAPEVVNFDAIGFCTDMWSVGVITYVLLSGLSPFMGETDVETMGNVTLAKFDFDDDAFNDVSEEALNFITQLLVKDPEKRLTASECLQHSWLLRRQQREKSLANGSVPQVQLKSDLSPSDSPTSLDNDQDCSSLSDLENSESDYAVDQVTDREIACSPPPLPKSQPPPPPLPKSAPPLDLLAESSIPIILPAHMDQEECLPVPKEAVQETRRQTHGDVDKELDLAKDNLKTFVERWDGSLPVEIPQQQKKNTMTAPNNATATTSNLLGEDGADDSALFISPAGNDNDCWREANHQHKQEKPKTSAGESENKVQVDRPSSPPTNSNSTKNLLAQLEQIEIKTTAPQSSQDGTNSLGGLKYLHVNGLSTESSSSASNSAMSSRGCSPSPCESLTSAKDMEEEQPAELAPKEESPVGLLRDYLQSFDRRKSDSNYVLGDKDKNNPSKKEEKMDLSGEIRLLSDHLMKLNTLKSEIKEKCEYERRDDANTAAIASEDPPPPTQTTTTTLGKGNSNESTKQKRSPRTKLADSNTLSSKLESKIVKSQIMRFSNHNTTSQVTTTTQHMSVNSNSSTSSVRTATRLIEELHKPETPISQPPWMLKCKRTKFRITELSRDVPQNAPESHKTIFIDQAATSTKDCLLQLLDKYNGIAGDQFMKRSLDIDRGVIPTSSSSSSSSIASLSPPVLQPSDHAVQKNGTTDDRVETVSTSQTTTTAAHSTKSTGKTVTNNFTTTTTTSRRMESSYEATAFEGKTGPCHPEFAKSIPRHFSLSLNWDKEGLEETTMNSLNAFFKRNSTHVGSASVKHIQEQMEARCGGGQN